MSAATSQNIPLSPPLIGLPMPLEFAEPPALGAPVVQNAEAPTPALTPQNQESQVSVSLPQSVESAPPEPNLKLEKKEIVRCVCSNCNRIIYGAAGKADRVDYMHCEPCLRAERNAESIRMVDRILKCKKCGSTIIARLYENDKSTTLDRCSRCATRPRVEEGTTFAPKGRVLRGGKRVGYAEAGGPRSMAAQDFLQYQDAHEADNELRSQIFSPLFVEDAKKEIKNVSIRGLQKQFGITYESARQGKIGVLRLQIERETLPQAPPPPKSVKRKPRKCPHGVWKHCNDRQKSRHCSACYPNIHADLVNWKSSNDDAAIKSLYLAGRGDRQAIKELAERFRMSQHKIRQALNRSGIALESDGRESKKPKKYAANKDSVARLPKRFVSTELCSFCPMTPRSSMKVLFSHVNCPQASLNRLTWIGPALRLCHFCIHPPCVRNLVVVPRTACARASRL